jgi:uncharacterized protein (DUF1800 family)
LNGHGEGLVSEADFAAMARTAVAAASDRNLQGWWLYRMLAGPHPLVERLTLFWHDHFATSQDKVANLALMHRQNDLFRRFALGRFWDHESGGLLLAVSRDPAMLVWLDSNSNRRAAPNENYARELMELFALGIGNYTETDIKQAARAFTGWFVQKQEFHLSSSEHDTTDKTVLGRNGNWDGTDVVRIVAEQPAAAEFLVGKLYRYLVSENDPPVSVPASAGSSDTKKPAKAGTPTPDSDAITTLAAAFREREYDVRWLVETMLRSELFFSPAAYRQKIASPVDFTLGAVRRLEGSRVSPVALADTCSKMGQTLFHPPNVAGWEEGKAWINSTTLLARSNFAQEIVSSRDGRFAGRTNPAALAAKYGRTSDPDVLDFFIELLVGGDLPADARAQLATSLTSPVEPRAGLRLGGSDERGERVRRLVQLILSLPEYNLC